MFDDITRRRALKLASTTAVAGVSTGVVGATGARSDGTDDLHALENDVEVKDFGEDPGEITVGLLRNGQRPEFEATFEFGDSGGSRARKQSVESADVEGDGDYVVRVRTPTAVTTKPMAIPRGGIQSEATILITRYPDESVRISLVLR